MLEVSGRRVEDLVLTLQVRSWNMALSDMAVRQARATGKAYTLGDTDGLSLAVTDHGSGFVE